MFSISLYCPWNLDHVSLYIAVIPKKNLNPRFIEDGIEQLEERNNIIIRPGGGVVILDKSFYDTRLEGMLLDENTYIKLRTDPTSLP